MLCNNRLANSYPLPRFDVEGYVVQHCWTVSRISRSQVFDFEATVSWPACRRTTFSCCFLFVFNF